MAFESGSQNEIADSIESNSKLSPDDIEYANMFDYLGDLSKEVDQAFYVFDVADVLWKVQNWREHLPKIQPFYAVKANSDEVLIKLMVILGLSFDCASENEIKMVLKAGGKPSDIIFANTYKPVPSLKYAAKVGVDLVTFDSEDELLKIYEHFPEARGILRICPLDVSASFDLSKKYGCDFEETCELLTKAKELGINIVGISFHVGSLCSNPISYTSTIEEVRRVFDVASRLGFQFTMLDIGGGFFGAKSTQSIFLKTCKAIKEALRVHFPEDRVRVVAEPGCYLVGSAFSLVTRIIGKRVFNDATARRKDGIQRFYYLNESSYGSFFKDFEMYDVRPLPLVKSPEHRPVFRSKLWGHTCCREDVIVPKCDFPDMEMGECIVWKNIGAYNRAVCSTFHGVPLPFNYYYMLQRPELDITKLPNQEQLTDFLQNLYVYVKSGVM